MNMQFNEGTATLSAAVIAAIVGILSLIQNNKSADKNRYLNIVSTNRVKWLQNFKNLIAQYCAIIQNSFCTENVSTGNVYDLSVKIQMQLNFKGNPDIIVIKIMDMIYDILLDSRNINRANPEYKKMVMKAGVLTKYLELASTLYFKTEWERIKFEAKDHLIKKFDCDEMYIKLAKSPYLANQLSSLKSKTGFDLIVEFQELTKIKKMDS